METLAVADARSNLSSLLARFRESPDAAPVAVGSHRKPEIVLLSLDAYRRLSEQTRPGVSLQRLRRLKPVIDRIACCANVDAVQVYGSVSRGDQTFESDVDLLVKLTADATLFDIAQFELDMEVLLGARVSAVSVDSLDPIRDAGILREAVSL